MLEALLHLGPMIQSALARTLLTSPSDLTAVLDNLERDGLVRRRRSSGGCAASWGSRRRRGRRGDARGGPPPRAGWPGQGRSGSGVRTRGARFALRARGACIAADFFRANSWISNDRTRLDFRERRATFIGAADLRGPGGGVLRADRGQPLFHVERSVGGEPGRPLNRWRIVHLTDAPDPRLRERLERMAEDPWLPEIVEIFLRDDLGIGLEHRDVE